MKCPKCEFENPSGIKFCGKCGVKLEKLCPRCNFSNPPEFEFCGECGYTLTKQVAEPTPAIALARPSPDPTSFTDGRYQVKKLLGEGGKKRVYMAHDVLLDRDVAFALISTEGLDVDSRARIEREAQAMGRLGSHQHIVTVFDYGQHEGGPYIVSELMPGGDVQRFIEQASEHKLPLEQAVEIAKAICRGLEHAHAKGIIHRDLKPGNVLLSAEGTPKIGDFGLAVTANVSRLTSEGMMVGTAFYMPPEQAMAKEVTPRSDLYSLGAMLYEMVTGRPPFVGDTSVAIITQHIDSSPPVSPTWHRKDIPPGLEVLIMQLLEKDPEKRPSSVTDVLKALEAIDLQITSRVPTEEVPIIDRGPLYRRTFVGRETYLKLLQSAFDGAASGNGTLIMVFGEPGIGKTAICEQLATYATVRGGKYLTGHCYEAGSLLFYRTFLVTGLSVGFGTVVVWVGLPILLIVLAGSWVLAAFERRMTIVMLQQDIGPMSGEANETSLGIWQRLKAHLGNQVTWTSMFYLLLKFPVGTVTFTVTVTLLATSLGLVFAPLIYQVSSPEIFTLWNGTTLTFWPVDSIGEAWLFTIGGLVLLVLSLHIINARARWSGQLALATLEKTRDVETKGR